MHPSPPPDAAQAAGFPPPTARLVAPAAPARAIAGGPRAVAQAWLASRGLIALAAVILALRQHRSLWDEVNGWDAALLSQLAAGGYWSDPRGNLMAFFPGLPLLLRGGLELGIPTPVSGVVIATIGSACAAAALYRLGGALAAGLWLFAPTAVFTTLGYTESLFCALAFWAWERARRDRWLAAGLLAAAACTVRVSGLFLVGALLIMLLTSWAEPTVRTRPSRREVIARARHAAWLLPALAVLFGYAAYLHHLTGTWTAWYHAQATGWVRGLTWPWQSAMNTWQAVKPGAFPDVPSWAPVFRFEVASMVVGLITTGWCLGRRRFAEASWVGVQVLAFSLSYWFFSVNRAVLLWFPTWIMLAELIRSVTARELGQGRRRVGLVVTGVVVTGLGLAMLWWCWLFFTGRWAS